MPSLPEMSIIIGVTVVILAILILPIIGVITLNIHTYIGTKYSRKKYWIWSITLLIISIPLVVISNVPMGNIKDVSRLTLLFVCLIFMMPNLLWINALVNRIRDYGSNPWIALWTFIPLVNIFIGLYYGIFKHKSQEKSSYSKDSSLVKAVYNHSKDIASEVKPTINEYKEKHQTNKAEFIDSQTDDEIYEKVMIEIEEDKKVKSTWAKALAQSDGDDKKAKSIYINLRVKNIQKEQIEIIQNQEKQTKLALLGGKELSQKEKDFLKKYNVDIFSENVNISSSSIIIKTPFGDKNFLRGTVQKSVSIR